MLPSHALFGALELKDLVAQEIRDDGKDSGVFRAWRIHTMCGFGCCVMHVSVLVQQCEASSNLRSGRDFSIPDLPVVV